MKALQILKGAALASLLLFTATACDGGDPDEYYIKYTVGINPGDNVNIRYNDVYHTFHDITGVRDSETVEEIMGPVWGGFHATINATVNDGEAPRFIQIDVSVNGAPYVTKEYVEKGKTATWVVPIAD
ncbi:MAG: hypothetical protein NC342_02080 [Pseudoflavonifractor sp.]|nr:hypothetical protein [Alloprevotella sp.]MCM1116313.1 hypothetical protein [Pseudoflavonifractor sp.]